MNFNNDEKTRVLVLGAAGMAGHMIYKTLEETGKYIVIGTTNTGSLEEISEKLDVFNIERVNQLVKKVKPNIIVNCVGILINTSRQNSEVAIYCNSYFPHALANIANANSAKLIHISTDCVFSGKTGGYTEDSFKDSNDTYGMSKSLGEINDNTNLTIRTSIIGPEIKETGEGLFDWFMKQSGLIYGYKSAWWSGVTTLVLAQFIDWVISKKLVGLVHLTNNKKINKFDLLHLFAQVHHKDDIIISSEKDYSVDKSFINTRTDMTFEVTDYVDMLNSQKDFITKHSYLYPHY